MNTEKATPGAGSPLEQTTSEREPKYLVVLIENGVFDYETIGLFTKEQAITKALIFHDDYKADHLECYPEDEDDPYLEECEQRVQSIKDMSRHPIEVASDVFLHFVLAREPYPSELKEINEYTETTG